MIVLSLAQDRAGYIWVGPEGGLYRYDGTRFRLMGLAEELPCGTEIHTLCVVGHGSLWTQAWTQIFRFDGQTFHAILGLSGPLGGAQRIAEDLHGHVVVSSGSGLTEALPSGGGSFVLRPYRLPTALEGKTIPGIPRYGSQLWFGCELHLCVEQGGRTSVLGSESGLPEDSWDGIAFAPDGTVWARSRSRLYRKPPGQARMIRRSRTWDPACSGAPPGSFMKRTCISHAGRSDAEYGSETWRLTYHPRSSEHDLQRELQLP
jgi:ligand-binding sensor domain-containing protein